MQTSYLEAPYWTLSNNVLYGCVTPTDEFPLLTPGEGGVVEAAEGAAVAEDGADQEGDGQAEGGGRRREGEGCAAGIVQSIFNHFNKFSFVKFYTVKFIIMLQITLEKKVLQKEGEKNISLLQNEINRRRKVQITTFRTLTAFY